MLDDNPETDVFLVDEIHGFTWKSMDLNTFHRFPSLNPRISSKSADFNEIHSHSFRKLTAKHHNERPLPQKGNPQWQIQDFL